MSSRRDQPPGGNRPKARGLLAFPRLFQLPAGKLVILEEQGRLVLCAGANGRLVYSQIVSATRDLNGHAAPEIRIASLALQQQGLVAAITGVELWGEFTAADAQMLERADRPARGGKAATGSDGSGGRARGQLRTCSREASRTLLRHRRRRQLRWIAPALAVILVAGWAAGERGKLVALEREAARMENAVSGVVDGGEPVEGRSGSRPRRAGTLVVAPARARTSKRYPLAILNGLTRCIPGGGVVIGRFESKVSELTVTGTARSAMEAYAYFNAVRQDADLGVYAWSMVEPGIAADGTATFQIKGQMR